MCFVNVDQGVSTGKLKVEKSKYPDFQKYFGFRHGNMSESDK